MENRIFSTSDYMSLEQCMKLAFLKKKHPDRMSPLSSDQIAAMSSGTKVGEVARHLFHGGVDVTAGGTLRGKELLRKTQELLTSENHILYEPAFATPCGTYSCRVDILVKSAKGLKLIEVKASTSFKDEHLPYISYKYMVLKQAMPGVQINAYVVYLNSNYVAEELLDLDRLFVMQKVTRNVVDHQVIVERNLYEYRVAMASRQPPQIAIGKQCTKPYPCPMKNYCTGELPEDSIMKIGLSNGKVKQLLAKGVTKVDEIPMDTNLKEQWITAEAAMENKIRKNDKALHKFLDTLNLSDGIFYADFEFYSPAIPMFVGTRPYQALCFQFCVLYKSPGQDTFQRREFIADPGPDPRYTFITNFLQATEGTECIIVYSAGAERSKLEQFAKDYPELSEEINQRISRIRDLSTPFQQKHFYAKSMKGKYSLKVVLPTLVPELSYKDLPINNGAVAMAAYEKMNSMSEAQRIITKRQLYDYCWLDVFGMTEIVRVLIELSNYKL